MLERAHELQVDLGDETLEVNGDVVRLTQVIANLLTNAAKYTDRRGRIALAIESAAANALIRVSDNGIGIDPVALPHVFEAFAQVHNAVDRSQGGLGLGLAIVRNLVALHGGTIEAISAGKGRGSEFRVRLATAEAMASPRQSGGRSGDGETHALRGRRVLVVDDNPDAAELLAEWLQSKGSEVRSAHDGAAALELVREWTPELGVIDIGLPLMDGYELARKLRERSASAPLLLVALTGYGQANDRLRSAEAGFNAHLVKPLELSRFEALVARLRVDVFAES
jgi:CheY-like chemotaxis protein